MQCKRDTTRAQTYNQRRALLADFMNFITAANDDERDQANDMLHTIDDISHKSSPTKDMNEGEDHRSIRMRAGHLAMINLQGAMALQLQGCGDWIHIFRWFMVWSCLPDNMTMLLIGYSWYWGGPLLGVQTSTALTNRGSRGAPFGEGTLSPLRRYLKPLPKGGRGAGGG